MTAAQQKNLNLRIKKAYAEKVSAVPSRYRNMPKMPHDVAHAAQMQRKYERIVAQWENRICAQYEAAKSRIDRQREQVETMILFGTPEQALAAVKKFEASK